MDNEKSNTPKTPRSLDTLQAQQKEKPKPAVVRRDATGHLDPAYVACLRAIGRETESETPRPAAFLHGMRSSDPLAEELGEDFVRTALSGEDDAEDAAPVIEEIGGPFVPTTGLTEFATGTDASNPASATREPFPKT